MRNLSVNWHEGMFLRPHHFQAAERYWNETLALNTDCVLPFAYGLHHIKIAQEALKHSCFEFDELRARWKDGTLISQDQVVRVDLGVRLEGAEYGNNPITVYLALPTTSENQPVVAVNGQADRARFTELEVPTPDEVVGKNPQPIQFRELNYSIRFGHEDLRGFEVIPIAQLLRTEPEGTYEINPDYFPPSLSLQAWPDLAGIVRKIYDMIGSQRDALKKIIVDKNISFAAQTRGHLEKMMLLHALNEAFGELSCLTFAKEYATGDVSKVVAPQVHPLVAYSVLCRIVGRCSIFGPELSLERVPEYDHEELAPIFNWALEEIRRLIFSFKPDLYEQRYFQGVGAAKMRVELESEWFTDEWEWYFGIDPVDLTRQECFDILRRNQLDWVVGSYDEVENLYERRRTGVKFGRVRQTPAALPPGNWIYLQIKQEENDDAWLNVRDSRSLAIKINPTQIANLDQLEGHRQVKVKLGQRRYAFEFAVFAVKKRI